MTIQSNRNAQLRESQKRSREKKKNLGKKQISITLDKSDYDKLKRLQKKSASTYSEIIHNFLLEEQVVKNQENLTVKLNGSSLFYLSKMAEYKSLLFSFEEVSKSFESLVKQSVNIALENKLEPMYKVLAYSLVDCISLKINFTVKQLDYLNSIEKCDKVSINHIINSIIKIAYQKFVDVHMSDSEGKQDVIMDMKIKTNEVIDCFIEKDIEQNGNIAKVYSDFDLNNILTMLEGYLYLDEKADKKIKEFYIRNYRTTQLQLKL